MKTLKIFFEKFDHKEALSKEVILIEEGLKKHKQIIITNNLNNCDYIVLLQNHLFPHNPFHKKYLNIKKKYSKKIIIIDFDDWLYQYEHPPFSIHSYFKRSIVDKSNEKFKLHNFNIPLENISYSVLSSSVTKNINNKRTVDISCLFNDDVIDCEYNKKGRGKVLTYLRNKNFDNFVTIFDTVSENGVVGRSKECSIYFNALRNTKILVTCNPDKWEGDSRLWEALGSGCLVFVDRMFTPIINPLIDGKHLIYYDLTENGLEILYKKILYYLENEDEYNKIRISGFNFLKENHLPIHRINQIFKNIIL